MPTKRRRCERFRRPDIDPTHWAMLMDAPRVFDLGEHAGNFYAREMCEPRKLLKGLGQPAWERFNVVPTMHLGIPTEWTGCDPDRLEFELQHDYLARFKMSAPGEGQSHEPVFIPEGMG